MLRSIIRLLVAVFVVLPIRLFVVLPARLIGGLAKGFGLVVQLLVLPLKLLLLPFRVIFR